MNYVLSPFCFRRSSHRTGMSEASIPYCTVHLSLLELVPAEKSASLSAPQLCLVFF